MPNNTSKPKVKIVKFAAMGLKKLYEDEKEDYATFSWSLRAGYPRISVFTTNKTNKGEKFDYNTLITAPFDYIAIQMLFTRFQQVINSATPVTYSIHCFNNEFKNGERTNNIKLQAKVVVGQDDKGVIFIAAIEDNKRKIKFELMPNKWHKNYNSDKEEITKNSELSLLYAQGYLRVLKKLMDSEMIKDMVWNPEQKKQIGNVVKNDNTSTTDVKDLFD